MSTQVAEALLYYNDDSIVSLRYLDSHKDEPLGVGSGYLALGVDGLKSEEKLIMPASRIGTAKILSEIVSSVARRGAILVVDDLHHLLNRMHGKKNAVLPDVILDVSFAKSFLGYDKDLTVEDLMRLEECNLARLGMKLFEKLNKRARKHYREVYIPQVQAYVSLEVQPVKIYRDDVLKNVYVQYEMHSVKSGRLVTKGDGKSKLFCAHFTTAKDRPGILKASQGRKIVSVDYTAAEIAVAAWFARDERALDMIRNGEDIYEFLASKIEIHRKAGKSVMVKWINGAGKPSIASTSELEEHTVADAIRFIKASFPQINQWVEDVSAKLREPDHEGNHTLQTPTGRIIHFDKDKAKTRARQLGPNGLMQSLNADLNNATYAELIRTFIDELQRVRPLIHLHDGYIFDIHEGMLEDDIDAITEIAKEVSLPYLANKDSLFLNVKTVVGDSWE